VDPEVLIPCSEKELTIGEFYQAKVLSSDDFDLYATVLD
jgi:ribosomal protein S12 methylthiotransferase